MTDLAFIVDTSDAALTAGRAAMPVSTDSTGAESFSGMLGERVQSGLARQAQASDSPPQTSTQASNEVVESGVVEPTNGNPLPLSSMPAEAALLDSTQVKRTNAALLAAMAQSVPRDVAVVASPVGEAEADVSLLPTSSLPGAALPGGLPNVLGETLPVARVTAQTASITVATLHDEPLPAANLAKQVISAKANEQSVEKQDGRSENGRAHATSITPALLAQPISQSAHRALVMAINETGLGKRVAPSIAGQMQSAPASTLKQSGLSSLPNGLTTVAQLASTTATPVANTSFEASVVNTRLTQQHMQQLTPSLNAVSPSAITGSTDDVSGLLSAGLRATPSVSSGFMPTMSVATPVGQAGWANEMGQRVAWMVQGELREAQLQLHPRSLGPVEVRIAYGHEQQLNVSFTAANPLAREALDAALPRLREMFEQQGLNLADANISQQSFSGQQNQESDERESGSSANHWPADTDELAEQGMLSNRLLMGDGMLDAYA